MFFTQCADYTTTPRSPTPEELTEIFLTGLREPLRTTLQIMDLSGQPIEEVIRRVLRLDSAQSMSMASLQEALPTTEETRFKQAIQCTTCLNPGHSALECTLRMHCPICHSRAHTLELCEYNLLNRNAATVRQIEPQTTQTAATAPRPAPRESERPRPRDRYRDDNRDWEDDYYRDYDYRRDDDYRRDYDYCRGDDYRRNENYCRHDNYDQDDDYFRNDYHDNQYNSNRRYTRENQGEHRSQEVHQERQGPPNNYRKRPSPARVDPPRPQEQQEQHLVSVTPASTDKGESSIHCFNCQEPRHYAPQCPHKQRGKQPTVNIITLEVQQVTTWSKAKTAEWEEQDEIRKAAKEWVEEANSNNVSRTLRENITLIVTTDKFDNQQVDPSTTTDVEDDEVWKTLADSKISLPLSTLLKLVPCFTNKVTQIIAKNKTEEVAVNFTNLTQGPRIMD